MLFYNNNINDRIIIVDVLLLLELGKIRIEEVTVR